MICNVKFVLKAFRHFSGQYVPYVAPIDYEGTHRFGLSMRCEVAPTNGAASRHLPAAISRILLRVYIGITHGEVRTQPSARNRIEKLLPYSEVGDRWKPARCG